MELKVMTYNIHSGIGMDGVRDVHRISGVIKQTGADIIGLNEVQHKTTLSEGEAQEEVIASNLGYNYCFGKSIDHKGGAYGNALLSKYPIISNKIHILEQPKGYKEETRSILQCEILVKDIKFNVLVTHLGLTSEERKKSSKYIVNLVKELDGPVILVGDFNAEYDTEELQYIMTSLKDPVYELKNNRRIKTFDSLNPTIGIDFILISKDIKAKSVEVIKSKASDHLPVVVPLICRTRDGSRSVKKSNK